MYRLHMVGEGKWKQFGVSLSNLTDVMNVIKLTIDDMGEDKIVSISIKREEGEIWPRFNSRV